MAVFYKYVDRQVSDQINWADISKSMSQTFDAERDAREKKKAEINQASLEYVEKLQSQPETESANLNSRMSQFITDASSLQKSNLDDLKQGRITLRDYTLRTQNLKSDSVAALDSIQTYGKRYSEVMKGIKDGTLSAAQADFMSRFEGFANLANNRLYVEPTSGRVFIANEVIDPVTGVKKMGDNIQNIASLKNMMEQDIPRVDVNSELDVRAKALGGFITEEVRKGKLYRIGEEVKFEDATKQQYYDKYLKDLTEELVGGASNPSTVSFFVDNMRVAPNGKPYKLVYSEEDRKNPSDILVKQGAGGVYFPELTKEQVDAAEEHVKIQMRQKIKSSTEKQSITIPEYPQPKSDDDGGKGAKNDKNLAGMVLLLKHGTPERKKAALSGLESTEGMKGFRFKFTADNKLYIENVADPSKSSQPIDLNLSDKDFVGALAQATGIGDINKALKGAYEAYPEFKGKAGFVSMGGEYTSEKSDLTNMQKFSQIAPNLLPSTISTDDAEFVDNFNQSDLVLKYGYKVNAPFDLTANNIQITAPPVYDREGKLLRNGAKIEIDLDKDPNPTATINKFIQNNPPSDYKLKEASEDLNKTWQSRRGTTTPAAATGINTSQY
jgi:hypothetical protein